MLNPDLLFSSELFDELLSSPINGTKSRGVYNPMQFVLRLRKDIQHELNNVIPGIHTSGSLSDNQTQAFSTYLHETIHWWQHVGSNFGFISSLKFPAQAHIVHSDLKSLLNENGAFKSIAKYDRQQPNNNIHVNKILNYWHDIEFAGQIAFDPKRINTIVNNPYFECWGHSYDLMWASSIWTLGSTFDEEFSFLPKIKEWEDGFKKLREKKVQGYYYGSPIAIPPIGIRAIYEGQARFSQLQYLYGAQGYKYDLNDFAKAGMLSGIYVEAFNIFLSILNEQTPVKPNDPLVGLFLLICDIAINPTNGFPFNVTNYESFIVSNDPGHRFYTLCKEVRDRYSSLKFAIQDYSKEEYITISNLLANSINCFSPHESAAFVLRWMYSEQSIISLLKEEVNYKFPSKNLPIRLFFSKFLRFQEDKHKYPQIFCWPGMNFIEIKKKDLDLFEAFQLFEKHKALFIDDVNGDIYHSAIKGYTDQQVDETLNGFFAWNSVYDMVRQWIIEDGPFKFNYEWLSSKYTHEEMKEWASKNFETSFGLRPEDFKIL
ncbi:hypothetical protein KXD93_02965 [Mucilaginibacter sp. BJC16-A38]|uniref:hypothetical protein n=1 Tax=Mucilaginibacter phenanthrenivorans TaxID=1234842 RepID=UPI0021582923|nr:hypothetical protein [Mucilaginibacter phenanthrenivorans]MCR8556582.1 hypothetical protein [Mucilaginibacter phenanthrenivorans]